MFFPKYKRIIRLKIQSILVFKPPSNFKANRTNKNLHTQKNQTIMSGGNNNNNNSTSSNINSINNINTIIQSFDYALNTMETSSINVCKQF